MTRSLLLQPRHQSSGLNQSFNGEQLTFADYIKQSRDMIARARAEQDSCALQEIVEGNSPFELMPGVGYSAGLQKSYQRGVLLIHGLTDSPYFMRHLATVFQENGFRVLAILLPGHGTRPGDLLETDWHEWLKTVAYGVEKLSLEVEEIFLAGFSAGGALSLYHSLCDQRVRGLFLFAPALKVTSKAAWADVHRLYSWWVPAAKWLSVHADQDHFKYESFPKNAAAQMFSLTSALQKMIAQRALNIPIFTVVSQDDATVDTAATVDFMRQAQNPFNHLLCYFSEQGPVSEESVNPKVECVRAVLPEQKIVSSAHTAIVLSPEDRYYGATTQYCNCLHYYPKEMKKFEVCRAGAAQVMQGEISEKNLREHLIRRLMYNPHFAGMRRSIEIFIDRLPR